MRKAYSTEYGSFYLGKFENLPRWKKFEHLYGTVDLLLTSPPFPLRRKKRYGNLQGSEYVEWLARYSNLFKTLLSPLGSIVMEVGNSWLPGSPTMSTLAIEALLAFKQKGNLKLCEQFIWYNKARLPGPAQWVNIERIRVKDSFTYIWWMSNTDRPKANNRNVLVPYSDSMKRLLKTGSYNPGRRPSDHCIGKTSFSCDNSGAIPSNVLITSNTKSNGPYIEYCRDQGIRPHPARMPNEVAEFFIKFLTEPGDLVLDPFAGSNTTGAAAERLERRWVSFEPQEDYVRGSRGWFTV